VLVFCYLRLTFSYLAMEFFMETVKIGGLLPSSRLIYGCMRLAGDGSAAAEKRAEAALEAALEAGFTHFDHADIYADGVSEKIFGRFLKKRPGLREKILITGKAGIILPAEGRVGHYDFSRDYLIGAVEASLRRLNCDYLDLFLPHRPDFLMNADDLAGIFAELHESGKVRHFGVSNFSVSQLELLRSRCSQPLLVNQIEVNLHNLSALENGQLDQCQRLKVTPLAWCPLAGVAYPGWGESPGAETAARLEAELERQAVSYGVDRCLIALAFLLKQPSGIVPLIGSLSPERIALAPQALKIDYEREDWYRLLEARRGRPVD
jgi:predicted oxidoreductase